MTQQFIIQGRIVFGHPGKPRVKKDVRTKQPIIKDGQPVQQYVFGVAIEKNMFNQQVLPYLHQEARTAFPNGVPQNFAWKYKDGDSIDSKGQSFATREGYAGHCVMTISTEGFAPQLFKQQPHGGFEQISAEQVKCGDYVAVNVTIKYNGATSPNTPGLYVNPNGIIHIGYGTEIVSSGQDPEEMFSGFQAAQFAGMSAQPMMPQGALPSAMQPGNGYAGVAPAMPHGGMPNAPTAAPIPNGAPMNAQYGQPQQYPAQPQPMPGYAPAAGQLPPPAHDFVQNAVGQPPQYNPAGHAPQPVQAHQVNQYHGAAPVGNAPTATGYPSNGMPGMPMGR